MNRSEFRIELENNFGNSMVKEYEDFCYYQDMIWEILLWAKDLFENNNIHYQLAHGSLLGLIRDQGQIPWDYDIDLFVPFVERKKLIDLLNTSLPEQYYYISYEIDPRYYDTLLRIVPKGYNEAFFHLDVFFVIGTASDIDECNTHRSEIYETFFQRYYKLFNPYLAAYGRVKSTIRLSFIKLYYQKYSLDTLNNRLIQLAYEYPLQDSKFVTTLDQWTKTRRFPRSILNTRLYEVEAEKYRIPESYESILSQLYGDYKKVPSLDSRVREFRTHLERINKFR